MLPRTTALTLVLLVHGTCATDVQDAAQRRMQRRAGRNDGPLKYLHSRPVKSNAFDEAVSQKMGGYTAPYTPYTPPYAPSVTAPPYVAPPYVPPVYVPPVYVPPVYVPPYVPPYVAPYISPYVNHGAGMSINIPYGDFDLGRLEGTNGGVVSPPCTTCSANEHSTGCYTCVANACISCGANQHATGCYGSCVANACITCGANQHATGCYGTCVPDACITCGANQHATSCYGSCVANACITCGANQHATGCYGSCAADACISCGANQHATSCYGVCVDDPCIKCGANQHATGCHGTCVPDACITCGANQHATGCHGTCVADPCISCGANQHSTGCYGTCVDNPCLACGAHQHATSCYGTCVADACTTCGANQHATSCYAPCVPKPVHGKWGDWGGWSSCTEGCGDKCHCKASTRTRICNYVSSSVLRRRLKKVSAAAHWIACAGSATESKPCAALSCAPGTFNDKQCCTVCAQGHFQAASGQASCEACPAGQSQSAEGQTACAVCALGRFQPTAGQAICNPAPCCDGGQQAVRPDDRKSASCEACANGMFKTMNQDNACTAPCEPCPAGKFHAKGAAGDDGAEECTSAPPGHFTDTPGQVKPECCGLGEYQDQHGQKTCKPCPGGTFARDTCRASCASHTCCGHGEYGEHTASESTCLDCAAGSVRDGSGQCDGTCTKCGRGKFANDDNTGCGDCPAGQFSTGAANTACTMCTAGMYQKDHGKTACTDASPGHYVPDLGLSYQTPHVRCPCGQFGVGASPTKPGTCQNCAVGHFKGAEGAYAEQCAPCPAGQFAEGTGFCACKMCAEGSFQDEKAQEGCKGCPAGRFGDKKGAIGVHWCPHCAGGQYQEDAGTTSCNQCEDGTRGNDAVATHMSSHCAKCPAGKFFAQSLAASNGGEYADSHAAGECVMCESGQYQHAPQQATCHSCSVAKPPFTEGDTVLHKWWTRNEPGWSSCVRQPFACVPSEWTGWSTCSKSCNGGRQTRTRDVKHESWGGGAACVDIDATLFKNGGWEQERACNDGCCPIDCAAKDWAEYVWSSCTMSCGGGSRSRSRPVTVEPQCGGAECPVLDQVETCNSQGCPVDCEIGQWGSWSICTEGCGTGTQSRSRTAKLPAAEGGKKCPHKTEQQLCNKQCCTGFHHDGDACTACAAGHFASSQGVAQCEACPKGTYQTFEGSHKCERCPRGTFQPGTAKTSLEKHCQHCGAGKYQAFSGASSCTKCTFGHFHSGIKQTSVTACVKCAPGQFADTEASSACADCDVGTFSSKEGEKACTKCAAGKHNPYIARYSERYCYECPCGKWATSGSNVCNDCPSGSFRSRSAGVNAASCTQATLGFEPTRNEAGNLCAQRACAVGRYQNTAGLGSCKECPAGTFGAASQAKDVSSCSACPAGTWSSTGSSSCTKCEAGRFNSQKGVADRSGCLQCETGTYSDASGAAQCTSCVPGRWQDKPLSTVCELCAAGQYSTASAATSSGACVRCKAGLHQPGAGMTVCVACDSGTYSDGEGTATCKSCAKGTANGSTGSSSAAACQLCSAGHFAEASGSAICKQCALGRAVSARGSTTESACAHCSAGQFADAAGSATCVSCAKGKHGRRAQLGGMSESGHCLQCPEGKFQQADGMTACVDCESGKYTTIEHDKISCHTCAVLDSVRKYDTKGLAGQKQCWPVPLACAPGSWGSWGACTKSCGTGQHTHSRPPLRQPATGPCGVGEDQCTAAWGGGASCGSMVWSETRNCNEQACAVDCVMSTWSSWTQCTRTCGMGKTSRARVMTRAPNFGGKVCPTPHEQVSCNEHSCALSALPTMCHSGHVRCAVQRLSHPNSISNRPELNTCGHTTTRIDEGDPCWEAGDCNTVHRRPGWCHEADTDGERALAQRLGSAKFPTLVVSHNKVREGQFHCQRTAQDSSKCHCVCNTHTPCCSREDLVVNKGEVLLGNTFQDVAVVQDCCNMCSNHPKCSAWEYTEARTCTLMRVTAHVVHGQDIVLVNQKDATGPKRWAGARAGVGCASAKKFW